MFSCPTYRKIYSIETLNGIGKVDFEKYRVIDFLINVEIPPQEDDRNGYFSYTVVVEFGYD